MAGDLALELPVISIRVENAVAEEVGEGGAAFLAFLVVGEVGLQDVLDNGGIGGDDEAAAERVVESEGV